MENHLPLLSNICDIRARHYLINLKSSYETKAFYGNVIIFFEATSPCEKIGKCCTRKCFCNGDRPVSEGILNFEESIIPNENLSDGIINTEENSDDISDFELILDCCDIDIKHVNEVLCDKDEVEDYLNPKNKRKCTADRKHWYCKTQNPLRFTVSEWCIKIVKPGVKTVENFPQVICIDYKTMPHGKSVVWQNDKDGNLCVYTPGASVNNRSLLPCQDLPSAMATWQAWITVPEGYHVSLTGDESQEIYSTDVGYCSSLQCQDLLTSKSEVCFYYYTLMVLPIATIAIAIGKWTVKKLILPSVIKQKQNVMSSMQNSSEQQNESKLKKLCDSHKDICKHYEYPCHMKNDWNNDTQITAVYPASLAEEIIVLCKFLPYAVKAAVQLLGLYPCHRIEVVILPNCFGSLGLASPNLIFLSPTVAIDDVTAFIRITHEISHAWFGINIGAQDWTEEWISEGFATYMEDLIFTEAFLEYQKDQFTNICKIQDKAFPETNSYTISEKVVTRTQLSELADLRAHLRYRTLRNELENSNEDLQTLQPMQGESLAVNGINFVKDGLNPEKTFLQIHYLKGYFLLKFLMKIVGKENFSNAMAAYVAQYHGQLVISQEILIFFIKECPDTLGEISLTHFSKNWLREPSLNKETIDMYEVISNSLTLQVFEHFHFWERSNKMLKTGSGKKLKCELHAFVFPDQLVLLFEYLLELPKIHNRILSNIFAHYQVTKMNADVRHRWCEIVIKHNFHDLSEVKRFLIDDQSMGVYLYGELMISRKSNHRKLARNIFATCKHTMDENTCLTVQTMLYGE